MHPSVAAFAAGLGIGASLIIAIGAQNAFVLRQGLSRSHVAAVVAVCVVCDWTLIAFGAFGFGSLVRAFPLVTSVAAWGGALFLIGYGTLSLRSALHPDVLHAADADADARDGESESAPAGGHGERRATALATTGAAVGATLAVSLLNPHVYLDTVVLLGSVAGQYPPASRAWFALGAGTASTLWFSGLGFGARLLAPLFERPAAWRVLDASIAAVMWWIAYSLIAGQLH